MVMRMLSEGGLSVLDDGARPADAANPRGYYEFGPALRLADDASFLDRPGPFAVKIVAHLLPCLPAGRPYRVIFVEREVGAVAASQDEMIARRGGGARDPGAARLLERHLEEVRRRLEGRGDLDGLRLRYEEILAAPAETARRISAFLGGGLDVARMAAAVEPALDRHGRGARRPALLSVDLEDAADARFFRRRSRPNPAATRREALALRHAIERRGAAATWFVLGTVACADPDLVRGIAAAGHEVGCHLDRHVPLATRPPAEVRRALAETRRRLEDLSGAPVVGFRAPNWSLPREDGPYADAILEAGFRYSSSVYPAWTPFWGEARAPLDPYRRANGLWEVPPSVLRLGPLRLPSGGGFWLRRFGRRYVARSLEGSSVPHLYLHPWEAAESAAAVGAILDGFSWRPVSSAVGARADVAAAERSRA